MEHTPIPWRAVHDPNNDGSDVWKIYAPGYALRVSIESLDGDAEANAAFIVQAVNAHQALAEALEGLREACEDVYKAGHIRALPFVHAGNVLKKARGEE